MTREQMDLVKDAHHIAILNGSYVKAEAIKQLMLERQHLLDAVKDVRSKLGAMLDLLEPAE